MAGNFLFLDVGIVTEMFILEKFIAKCIYNMCTHLNIHLLQLVHYKWMSIGVLKES